MCVRESSGNERCSQVCTRVCVLKKLERWTNNHSHPANRSRPLPDFGEAAMSARCSARVVPACARTSLFPPVPLGSHSSLSTCCARSQGGSQLQCVTSTPQLPRQARGGRRVGGGGGGTCHGHRVGLDLRSWYLRHSVSVAAALLLFA